MLPDVSPVSLSVTPMMQHSWGPDISLQLSREVMIEHVELTFVPFPEQTDHCRQCTHSLCRNVHMLYKPVVCRHTIENEYTVRCCWIWWGRFSSTLTLALRHLEQALTGRLTRKCGVVSDDSIGKMSTLSSSRSDAIGSLWFKDPEWEMRAKTLEKFDRHKYCELCCLMF